MHKKIIPNTTTHPTIRTEDILYFEAVQNKVFAYTSNKFYEIKSRLYQLEEKITRKCM